mmetsp:Transcript_49523/g.99779  ORF Transcript_49523/g.99779 Transcript_49523/m.99779 type:complete len:290 (+) Transcript_49523:377-1246(+)
MRGGAAGCSSSRCNLAGTARRPLSPGHLPRGGGDGPPHCASNAVVRIGNEVNAQGHANSRSQISGLVLHLREEVAATEAARPVGQAEGVGRSQHGAAAEPRASLARPGAGARGAGVLPRLRLLGPEAEVHAPEGPVLHSQRPVAAARVGDGDESGMRGQRQDAVRQGCRRRLPSLRGGAVFSADRNLNAVGARPVHALQVEDEGVAGTAAAAERRQRIAQLGGVHGRAHDGDVRDAATVAPLPDARGAVQAGLAWQASAAATAAAAGGKRVARGEHAHDAAAPVERLGG